MPSTADLVSFIHTNQRRSRRALVSFVLLLAAASIFVLASVGSRGGIDGFGTLRIKGMEGGMTAEAKSEEHPIFELMREGEKQ
jgi:hypothetical protein